MRKLLVILAVCALTLPAGNAYAEQKKSDKPDKVIVKTDGNGQLKEVVVIVHRDKK